MIETLSLGDKMGNFESIKALLQSTTLDLFNHFRDVEYRQLDGREITLMQASEKYGVPKGTIQGWVAQGTIQAMRPGVAGGVPTPAVFNERDIAARVALYRIRPNAKLKTFIAKTA